MPTININTVKITNQIQGDAIPLQLSFDNKITESISYNKKKSPQLSEYATLIYTYINTDNIIKQLLKQCKQNNNKMPLIPLDVVKIENIQCHKETINDSIKQVVSFTQKGLDNLNYYILQNLKQRTNSVLNDENFITTENGII